MLAFFGVVFCVRQHCLLQVSRACVSIRPFDDVFVDLLIDRRVAGTFSVVLCPYDVYFIILIVTRATTLSSDVRWLIILSK